MKKAMNKPDQESFIHAFMSYYKSPGLNIPWLKNAYEKPFTVTELRTSYKVTTSGITKRFTTLYYVAKFIFQHHFNEQHVHYADVPYKRIRSINNSSMYMRKLYAGKVVGALLGWKQKLVTAECWQ